MPPHYPPQSPALQLREALQLSLMRADRAEPVSDIEIARCAAAEANRQAGYPQLARPYLDGEWDGDIEVQAALIAIRMVRCADSIEGEAVR